MTILEKGQKLINEQNFPKWGILGSIIGFAFIITPMFFYVGTEGENFSIFNHFVSELGELGVSELGPMFNLGLILAGILFTPFMIGLGLYMNNIIAKISTIVGVYSCISVSLVGVFPMNHMYLHYVMARSFFISGLFMVILWTLAIIVQKEVKIPKILSLGGLVNAIFFASFLLETQSGLTITGDRPEFWLVTTLEWAIYFAIVAYLFIISIFIWNKEKGTEI